MQVKAQQQSPPSKVEKVQWNKFVDKFTEKVRWNKFVDKFTEKVRWNKFVDKVQWNEFVDSQKRCDGTNS